MRNNVRAVALQELLRLWAKYLPPGSRCPTSLYQLDKLTGCALCGGFDWRARNPPGAGELGAPGCDTPSDAAAASRR